MKLIDQIIDLRKPNLSNGIAPNRLTLNDSQIREVVQWVFEAKMQTFYLPSESPDEMVEKIKSGQGMLFGMAIMFDDRVSLPSCDYIEPFVASHG